jgi:hypothetical protein
MHTNFFHVAQFPFFIQSFKLRIYSNPSDLVESQMKTLERWGQVSEASKKIEYGKESLNDSKIKSSPKGMFLLWNMFLVSLRKKIYIYNLKFLFLIYEEKPKELEKEL